MIPATALATLRLDVGLHLPGLDIEGGLYSAAITGDRWHAVIGSQDGRIQIVDLDTGALADRGCGMVGRAATATDLGVTTEEVGLPCR